MKILPQTQPIRHGFVAQKALSTSSQPLTRTVDGTYLHITHDHLMADRYLEADSCSRGSNETGLDGSEPLTKPCDYTVRDSTSFDCSGRFAVNLLMRIQLGLERPLLKSLPITPQKTQKIAPDAEDFPLVQGSSYELSPFQKHDKITNGTFDKLINISPHAAHPRSWGREQRLDSVTVLCLALVTEMYP